MPEDLWHVERKAGKDFAAPSTLVTDQKYLLRKPNRITLKNSKREIRPDDWERFDIYASFVQHLGEREMQERSPMYFITLDDEVRRQLESRTPAVSLLPNLRTIVAWENDFPLTSLFLTPRVHHLKLMMDPRQRAPYPL